MTTRLIWYRERERERNDDDVFLKAEWRLFIAGGTHIVSELPNPSPDWISERMWKDILTLPALPKFAQLAQEFEKYSEDYKKMFDSPDPHKEPLPGHWDKDLDEFQKMLVLKCVRADKVTNAMQVQENCDFYRNVVSISFFLRILWL